MRKIVLCIVFFLFGVMMTLPAQETAQARFDRANTLFSQGDYTQAMDIYRQIKQSGEISGALFLNMGIAAVQTDSMGLAKYYFLKALAFEQTQPKAAEALEYVESQFSRQSATLPKLPWDRAVEWLNKEAGSSGTFLVGIIFVIGAVVMLCLQWFNILRIPVISWYRNGLLATGLAVLLTAFYADYVDYRYNEAILIQEQSQVMQKPANESNLVSLAYEGYKLTIDEWKSSHEDHWYYIRLGNGQYGWVKSEGIKKL
ncbi:MAG: SH3 domain-containing protein [Balneolaceae bacterium]|nr:SH3 domain-containing protein [Balneolaceae bacterium]